MYDIIVFEMKSPFSWKKDKHTFCKLKQRKEKRKNQHLESVLQNFLEKINTVKVFYKTCVLGPRKLRLRVDGRRVKRGKK